MNKRIIASVVAAVFVAAVLISSGPRGIATESRRTGTLDLTSHAERGHHQLAAFVLTDGTPEFGGLGADEHTEVEIGSVTKMFTVEITQQLIEEGALSRDTRIGEVLDLGDTPAADITVKELATHTSGLPRLANPDFFRSLVTMGTNGNPYEGETTEDILDAARTAQLENRGTKQYSNFGYALLGALLAEKTGTSYEELVRTRIFEPAGMTESYVALPGTVPADAPRGLAPNGRTTEAWEMEGSAPAGAIRSTAADMAKFAAWMCDHGHFDLGWEKEDNSDGTYWHNGGTGGYSTMLIIQPERHRAAYASNDGMTGVEDLARALFKEHA